MFKIESYKKGIVLSTLFNIFNKGLVFFNGLLVAYLFGSTTSTDLFFFIYNSVGILGAYFTSMNNSVIIPEAMRIRVTEGEQESMKFLNFFLFFYVFFIAICIIASAFDPVNTFAIVSNFKEVELTSNKFLLYLSFPLFGLIVVINFMIETLSSYRFFTVSMFVGILNGTISIVFAFLFYKQLGIASVLYGMLLSYTANFFMLVYLLKRYLNWNFRLLKVSKSKRIWQNVGFAQLGNFSSTLSSYAPFYILSGFNTGIITSLTFAQQMSSLPNTLIINQFSSVIGIKFNELHSQKYYQEINRIFLNTVTFLMFIVFPISGICYLFSEDIIHILFSHGNFSSTGRQYASLFFKYLILLLPLLVINVLFSRLFVASQKVKEAFWYQVISNILLVAVIYLFIQSLGVVGYPLGMLAVYFVNIAGCYFLEKHYFNIIDYKKILKKFCLFLVLNCAIASLTYFIVEMLNIKSATISLFVGTASYLTIILIIAFNFDVNDQISLFTKQIRQKFFLQ